MIAKLFRVKLITIFSLTLLLTISPSVFAGYTPPPDQKRSSEYSKPGGRRGCNTSKIPLTIIAPKKYVAHTVSSHPTFAWYSSDSQPVEFRLFKFDKNGEPEQLGSPIESKGEPGIKTYSLPKNQPGLTIGETYLWQVAIKCPQGVLLSRSEFIVVPLLDKLSEKIAKTPNQIDKVDLYSQSSLWYDAFAEALKLAQDKGLDQPLLNLLQEVAIADTPNNKNQLEKSEIQELQNHVENLQQIAAIKKIPIN